MSLSATDSGAYMEAFMNGFEFVLLAIRGRLAEEDLPAAERARLEVFLADYSRIAAAYRDRRAAPKPVGLGIQGKVTRELEPVAVN
ncbi:MAG TPA: hypothetical protein VM370_02780 [Candidatus Thermoplasmatota archaeon]|nr:hypothetical protein [Candidatus Thermoplasmatota archaeon]